MALPVLLCEATTYYVSLSGNDSANGTTPETAFLSPSVATAKATNGDTIVLGKGTWTVTAAETWKGAIDLASGVSKTVADPTLDEMSLYPDRIQFDPYEFTYW